MFGSALVILAAMVVQHRSIVQIPSLQKQDMMLVFQKALGALQYLGSDTRMSSRCHKYLQRMMHGVLSLGTNAFWPKQIRFSINFLVCDE